MQKNWLIGFTIVYVVTSVAIGVGLYYAGYNADHSPEAKRDISTDLQEEITASKISDYLKYLSSVPHMAGTDQDLKQAEWVRDQFVSFGLDEVMVIPYQVLLSYPDKDQPNIVSLMEKDQAIFQSVGKQTALYSPEENSTFVPYNFNAYSGGDVGITKSDGLVYVHYGRDVDYQILEKEGIDVNGKIVLARYGGSFRGNIVALAEKKGAIGVLLYSDPQNVAQKGREPSQVYPNSWWMPGMAVQSGTIMLGNGDPLTPFYPAIESAYRIPESEAALPKIPAQPIGYDEAERLFRSLRGKVAPPEWQGNLNVSYSLGPEFESADMSIQMDIKTANKRVTTYNTIGILLGVEEPDRYVLVGNHRDAWGLGALDPSSGTASMMEMARSFGQMKTNFDWRPRRSLVFCSWGAEEYGLIGSYEWVEEHAKVLSQRAVAYLNADIAVEGTYTLFASGVPLMHKVYIESSKKVKNPSKDEIDQGRLTVYDTWIHRDPDTTQNKPNIYSLGSGSDHTAFLHNLGVPCIDIRHTYQENIGLFPLYHTLYETHHLMADIIDPGFTHHRAVAQLWAEIARNLTESIILPLDIHQYATYLTDSFARIKKRYEAQLVANYATLSYFESAVKNFSAATKQFQEETLDKIDVNDILAVRRVNDQLIQLERHFVDPRGLPNRPQYNHIVFAPSSSNTYASTEFSGLTDLLEAVANKPQTESQEEWAQIKQHLSVIAFFIEAAGRSLSDYL